MLKKDTLIIVGCVALFIVLAVLLFCETQNPEGGAALVTNLFRRASGH